MNYYDIDGNPITLDEFVHLMEDLDYRRVALDDLDSGPVVSTVWLGLDHTFNQTTSGPHEIFETMVFSGGLDALEQARYATRADAEAGHAAMVAKYRNGMPRND